MRDDRVYLAQVDEAIGKILSYTSGGRDEFMENPMAQDAVVRNFEIIGEATKHLSKVAKSRRPDIPWRDVAGFRDVLNHDYMGVDLEEVWRVIESHLPALRDAVRELLKA
ncbi:MAG: DUF86 domain-containing protein [Candidatus Brocadiae bacterium]|nr:DUF86 domain-containing protein [Candidatus Brocadiia bacterium]